ncbi:hypothetical protein C8R45DRAFT_947472, partial [Mycena sanguinolenta]
MPVRLGPEPWAPSSFIFFPLKRIEGPPQRKDDEPSPSVCEITTKDVGLSNGFMLLERLGAHGSMTFFLSLSAWIGTWGAGRRGSLAWRGVTIRIEHESCHGQLNRRLNLWSFLNLGYTHSPTESMTEGSISGPSTDDINNLLHLQRRDFLQNTGTSALHNWNGKAGSAGEIFHNFQHHPLSTKLKSLQMTASYPYVSRNLLGEGGSERGVRIVCSALKFLRMTNLPRVSVAINLSLTPECYIGKIFACMTKDVGLPNGSALRERLGAH